MSLPSSAVLVIRCHEGTVKLLSGAAEADDLETRGIYATGLVNNAGFGSHDALTNEDPDRLQSMIALNVSALVDLCRAYIDPLASADTAS